MAIYVVSGGKNLFLSQNADFVNSFTSKEIRVFDTNTLPIAKLIAKDIGMYVHAYKSSDAPKMKNKRIGNLRNKVKKLTKYEKEKLLVIKHKEETKDTYLTYENTLNKNVNATKVIKLPFNKIGEFYETVNPDEYYISQLKFEVKNSLL